ncbi:MAG: HAMP domain-containing histidine kinase [Clostridia bacterium]|nr:HAMP domain-containing histidine kinase [Clostridia bacterium]
MFKEMHLKFLLIPLILVGALLAITFSTIFSITYSSTTTDTEKALENGSLSTDNGRFYYVKIFENGDVEYSSNFNSMTEDDKKNIRALMNQDEGRFTYNDLSYAYLKKNTTLEDETKVTVYTILDWTERRNTLVTLGSTLIIVFFVSLLILGGLSYILAYSATQPVKEAFNKEKELLANASHELKTPITVAKTNLDLVLSDPSQTIAENKRWLEGAKYQIDRMNSLILQMLELSRLERNDYYAEKTDLNISTLIEGILLSFEAGCYESNKRFVSSLQPDVYYKCNKVETEKLITILVDNAIKYTPNGGEICVTLAKTLKNISIKVTNTGEGIPPELIDKIFDRFYKLDESHKEAGKSFGLGLSIAKLISQSMGGDIKCFSEVGRYTTFEITLPIIR